MSEQESATTITPPSQSEQDSTITAGEAQSKGDAAATATATAKMSFSIWPPAERTRDAVVARLVETLSTPSVLSKRYGTLPADEASAAARLIEEEAFATAAASAASDDDGIQILQVYSKEISKRMLDAVKARTASAAPLPADDPKVETEAS